MNAARQRQFWAVLLVAVVGVLIWQANNLQDLVVWLRLRPTLTEEQVAAASLSGAGERALSDAELAQVLAMLREARFEQSNRQKAGPTPSAVLTLTFRAGTELHLGFWGGERFELAPRHLNDRSQFLIRSEALGEWVKRRGGIEDE